MVKVLHDNWGIERGFMSTIHSYTGDQNLARCAPRRICAGRVRRP